MNLKPSRYLTAFENDCTNLDFCCSTARITGEGGAFSFIQTVFGKLEDIPGLLLQRIVFEPLNQNVELSILLQDVEHIVVPSVLPDQSIKLPWGRRRLPWFNSLEELVADANTGIHGDNFRFKVLIESAIGNQPISQHPQLGLESAPNRKHVQRPLALHQINRIIPFHIAGCKLASEFRGYRFASFERGKSLTGSQGQHHFQSMPGDGVGDRVRGIHGGYRHHAELVFRQTDHFCCEAVDRATVSDHAMTVQFRYCEPQTIAPLLSWLRELGRPHLLQGFALEDLRLRTTAAIEKHHEELSQISHGRVHATRGRQPQLEGGGGKLKPVVGPHVGFSKIAGQGPLRSKGALVPPERSEHSLLQIFGEGLVIQFLERVADYGNACV